MKFSHRQRWQRRLKALPEQTRKEMTVAVQKGADEINDLQRRFVPQDDGDLLRSISNKMVKNSSGLIVVEITAGGDATTRPVRKGADADYDYALGQEFGNTQNSAQPFFFPGFRIGKRRAKSRITRSINKAAKRDASS